MPFQYRLSAHMCCRANWRFHLTIRRTWVISSTDTLRGCSGSCTIITAVLHPGAGSTTTTTRLASRVRRARYSCGTTIAHIAGRSQGCRRDVLQIRPRSSFPAVRTTHGCASRSEQGAYSSTISSTFNEVKPPGLSDQMSVGSHVRSELAHLRLLSNGVRAGSEREEARLGGCREDPVHR